MHLLSSWYGVNIMATKPRGILKFGRQWVSNDAFVTVNTFKESGYYAVRIKNPSSYKDVKKISEWCDENIGHKHWLFRWDHWMFTHEKDAFLFKLAWSDP